MPDDLVAEVPGASVLAQLRHPVLVLLAKEGRHWKGPCMGASAHCPGRIGGDLSVEYLGLLNYPDHRYLGDHEYHDHHSSYLRLVVVLNRTREQR